MRSRAPQRTDPRDHDRVIGWYRRQLAKPAKVPWAGLPWEPVCIGPTWQVGEDGRWVLPERTLGWDVLGWTGTALALAGEPWRYTLEQARLVLWWFSLTEDGRWIYTDGVLQRLKGWGKDPFGATLCAAELVGPCRFAGWDDADQPIATDEPNAWIQTAAVALEQTKNTMRLLPGLLTDPTKAAYGIQVGKELVHADGDTRLLQAVTSAPRTLEGARPTFTLLNETQHWLVNNDGHEMAAVIDRNATKSAGGHARRLRITNAYEPSEDSVAQQDREAWEKAEAGQSLTTGILYDSLEAPPDAPLTAEAAPDVVRAVRGDSVWLDPATVVRSILDTRNPPSRSRRFWYNQITATEDAWVTPQEIDRQARPSLVVADKAIVTLGFDGSETDDDTALIVCDVEQAHLFPASAGDELGIWSPSKATGEIDRAAVDWMVRAMFDRYDVVGFYGDLHPFSSYLDRWAEEFGADLLVKSSTRHPIAWDMRRTRMATAMVERLRAALIDGAVTHDGNSAMVQHFRNARMAPNQWGTTVRKVHRESSRKIDSTPAAGLAWTARADYLALPESRRRRRKRTGRVW